MSAAPESFRRPGALPLRYAVRELRGGLRGFYVFIACIALGVMAIAGVGTVAASLGEGLAREGRTLLGGDVAFSLMQREATSEERAFLAGRGRLGVAATMRAMAQTDDGRFGLVEMKAVDDAYPELGRLMLDPPLPTSALLAERDGAFGLGADAALLARLELKVGDPVRIGQARFVIRSVVQSEPDKLAGGVGFGPRVLVSIDALRATQLLQPGSLVRWIYRVALPDNRADDAGAEALADGARQAFPAAGWDIRSRGNASPQLERSIERFSQFLTLVGLAALLVGGVGVANAVKSHVDRRQTVIATLKALGAAGPDVFAVYLTQVMVLAAIGSMIGLALGAALPFVIAGLFGALLPLPLTPTVDPKILALALVYGLLTAAVFGLWPLARVDRVPVATLFRDVALAERTTPARRHLAAMALASAALIAVVIGLSYDRRIAAVFVASSLVAFALLQVIALALMAFASRLPRPRQTLLRLALTNIHRPGALTPSVVMSLGLGLAVLVTVTQIDGNLRRQFMAALPDRAPSFYFIDIPSTDADRFQAFMKDRAPNASVEEVPMLRGRIVAARGVRAEAMKPSQDSEWVLQSDRGLTYTDQVPRGSRIVDGEWWPPGHRGPPLVSLEKRIADGLGLGLGDDITVNVLGRDITARIANLRTVDWQSLGINFVLVYSPNAFAGAPHTHIATLTDADRSADDDAALIRAVAEAFPMVTSVRVKEALETVGGVVVKLANALRGASAITVLASILVLGGALAAGHRQRVYDAVILKTLGATRGRLLAAYALEYLAIGLATAVFAVAAGSVAAWLIVTRLMMLTFTWQPGAALAVSAAALGITVGLGLIGTLAALNNKPAAVLRNL